jgi:DNA-binding response OmpR family regulator
MNVLSLDLHPDDGSLNPHYQVLREHHIDVTKAHSVPDATNEASNGRFSAILVHDGSDQSLEAVTEIRKVTGTPLIVIRKDLDPEGSIALFEAGADDVVTESADPTELAARLRSMARRCTPGKREKLLVGDLELSPKDFTVFRGGKRVMLTNREFDLLEYLMEHRDRVLTRSELADQVWGDEVEWSSNVIDVSIGRLRSKIHLPGHSALIHTVTGRGYMMSDAPPATNAV